MEPFGSKFWMSVVFVVLIESYRDTFFYWHVIDLTAGFWSVVGKCNRCCRRVKRCLRCRFGEKKRGGSSRVTGVSVGAAPSEEVDIG